MTIDEAIEIHMNGAVARLTKARKPYKCYSCGDPIEPGEYHYCVYYGMGLGSLKFPDRVHQGCLGRIYKGGEK